MKHFTFNFFLAASLISCGVNQETSGRIDVQGHRGARGLFPENSIPGFIAALDYGVTTLEMDLAVTRDSQLVVSHEPYISAEICYDSAGNGISQEEELNYNIYKMNYQQLSQFDCGSKPHPRFPDQKKIAVTKPLLIDVFDTVEVYLNRRGMDPVSFNIEIKSLPIGDNIYHPEPPEFGDLVFNTINERVDWSRITIQSFDFRVLQYFHETYPKVKLALLIENSLPFNENLDSLGFVPEIYSCYYELLDESVITLLHEKGIQVIPWTVNELDEMQKLISMGVDGIITDYPNRYYHEY